MANNYYIASEKRKCAKAMWLARNNQLNNEAGIYILTRTDENGLQYAYIGQSKHILNRLADHIFGYEYIDKSLKKHKLYDSVKNPFGWKVDFFNCRIEDLNNLEHEYIIKYAKLGYQLRNKTTGSQGVGKLGIDENKPSKGYRDGLKQGYSNCLKDIREYFDKYLEVDIKVDENTLKKNGQIKEIYKKKFQEFVELLWENPNERAEDNNTMDQESD